MKYCQPIYYNDFKCVASECSDTCCRYWQVELDDASYEYFKNKPFINKGNIGGLFGGHHFRNKCNGNCSFLNDEFLCELYDIVGHENLPRTCQLYPRFINNFGGYEERGLSFSCPTAAKMIVERDFILTEYTDESPIESFTDIDGELFIALKKFRNSFIEVVDMFENSYELFSFVFLAAKKLQNKIINQDFCFSEITDKDLLDFSVKIDYKKLCKHSFKTHLKHKHLRMEWPELLNDSKENFKDVNIYLAKVWIKYFVFRYLLNASKDRRVDEKMYAAVYSALIVFNLNSDPVDAMQKYSKETEHNAYNIKKLFKDSKYINKAVDK